ncbi:Maf family protein [Thermoanaerobacterium sp. DL9XJH110]|uniref:Maf family protein n=1 Tax=Thermoanaerobacterium sp. DL9XJH110 TaxID=3386643 RepID=UPI003BB52397
MSKRLILASASPRRRQLLAQLGLEFSVEPSNHSENLVENLAPGPLAVSLAEQKAKAVARRHREGIIIGADTIVAIGEKVLGKPANAEDAVKMLTRLSGRWHSVFTGLVLIEAETNRQLRGYEESRVKFKVLSEKEIKNYIKTGEVWDKAGAYAIQGMGALFVEKIEGCYYNIVGLPLYKLSTMLKEFGMEIL